jgi:hypothetical protein
MSLDKAAECSVYLFGNATEFVRTIFPGGLLFLSGGKTGLRLGKTVRSFKKAGFYNPSFYFNAASFACSSTSYVLARSSQLAKQAYPSVAYQLYVGSAMLGGTADVLDDVAGIDSFFS